MRVIDIDNDVLHIPDGWTAFLFNGALYTVSDEGTVTRHDTWDVEQATVEQQRDNNDAREIAAYERHRETYEKTLHKRERRRGQW